MATVPFSLRLDSDIKIQLEKEAKEHDRTASHIAVKAITNYLQAKENKRKAIDEAIKCAEKGAFISQKNMGLWVDSWGADNELPQPKPDVFVNDEL